MSIQRMKRLGIAVLAVLIASGCSTQARRVNCDGRLEPINQLAPAAPLAPGVSSETPATQERITP